MAGNRKRQRVTGFLGGMLLATTALSAHADWAGFGRFGAIAELNIEARILHVNLRMRGRALPRLSRMAIPNNPDLPVERIATELLALGDEAGKPLAGHVITVRRIVPATDFGRSPSESAAAEPYSEAEMEYDLPETASALTLSPRLGAANTDLGLIALDRGIPVNDLAPLKGPVTLHLNRKDPWLSRFDDPGFVRRHSEPQSYLYVEPYELRHEILIRLQDLPPDLLPDHSGRIESAEQAPLRRAIGRYLLGKNPVRIDGAAATPQLDRVEFVRFGRRGVEVIPESEPLQGVTALVGVILVYLTDRPARTIELEWETFGEWNAQRLVSVLFEQETFESYVSRRHPVFQWSTTDEVLEASEESPATPPATASAPLPASTVTCLRAAGIAVALAALLRLLQRSRPRARGTTAESALLLALAGCVAFYPEIDSSSAAAEVPRPIDETARMELRALLHNVYRAFQIRGEETAYDRLALSLSGELLDEIYLRQRRALLTRDGGFGGEAQVNRIDVLDSHVARESEAGMEVMARWIAHGTVSHWSHSHERSNEYRALFVLSRSEGRWKISGLEFLDARGNPAPDS